MCYLLKQKIIATKLLQVIKNEEFKRLIKNGNINHMEIRDFAALAHARDVQEPESEAEPESSKFSEAGLDSELNLTSKLELELLPELPFLYSYYCNVN